MEPSPTLKASGLSLATRLLQTLCLWTHPIPTWAGVPKIVVNATDSARQEARLLESQQQLASASSFKLRTDAAMVISSPVKPSGADRKCRHGTVLQTQASVLSRDPPTTMVIQHTSTCKMPTSKSHRASAGTTLKLLMRKSAAAKAASATGLRIATASSQTQPMMPLRLFSDCYFCI